MSIGIHFLEAVAFIAAFMIPQRHKAVLRDFQ